MIVGGSHQQMMGPGALVVLHKLDNEPVNADNIVRDGRLSLSQTAFQYCRGTAPARARSCVEQQGPVPGATVGTTVLRGAPIPLIAAWQPAPRA